LGKRLFTFHDSAKKHHIFSVTKKLRFLNKFETRRNDLIKALLDAFEIINKFRDLTGADNYLGGRDPYKTDHGIVIYLILK